MSLLFGTLLFLAILAAVFYQNCTSHETWLPQSQPLCHDLLSWSKNGKMPKDTQQHAQLFVDGLREFTSEKVQQAYKYDYAAKFEETKQNAVWLSGRAKEKSKELYNEASVWYEKELGPKARNAGKELRIKADWLWAESKVAARYVANKSYDMIQQTILIVSKAVRWASETGNEIYTNREQYWQYACDLSNYYWKQAKYYWENVV